MCSIELHQLAHCESNRRILAKGEAAAAAPRSRPPAALPRVRALCEAAPRSRSRAAWRALPCSLGYVPRCMDTYAAQRRWLYGPAHVACAAHARRMWLCSVTARARARLPSP